MLGDVHRRTSSIRGNKIKKTAPFRRIDGATVNSDNEYEVGVASGYAIQHPTPSGFVLPQHHSNDLQYENIQKYSVAGSKAGLCIASQLYLIS